MKFGMTEDQFQILDSLVIGPLKKNGARVFLFGSRATGQHHPHSDVDILYKPGPNFELATNLISEIKESIEESRFPFKVELVAESDLAESYKPSVTKNLVEL